MGVVFLNFLYNIGSVHRGHYPSNSKGKVEKKGKCFFEAL